MNTKAAILAGLCCCMLQYATSQYYYYDDSYYDKDFLFEINASGGAMNALTDIGGHSGRGRGFVKDLNLSATRPCGSLGAGLLYCYMLGLKITGTYGTVTATDAVLRGDQTNAKYRYERNLNFQSPVAEVAVLGELFFLQALANVSGEKRLLCSPYILGGIGMFHFNPQAELNGGLVALKPLHTEGQGFAEYPDRPGYSLTALAFPVGIGLRYDLSAAFHIRFEVLHRITTTDYLDDVSTGYIDPALFNKYLTADNAQLAIALSDRQAALNGLHTNQPGSIRGRSNKRDSYFTVELKIGLTLGRERR
ncbi:MAG: hypothetical protein J0H29_07590 [Sphingobacteriales bacterium]|nr:hypothetical protein [Sphingobacteriales bacterium]